MASQCTKLAIHGCYKSVYQKPVVDDQKLGVISYFRQDSCLSLSGSERASSHDVTTSDHFLMSQIRAIRRVLFARTGHLWLDMGRTFFNYFLIKLVFVVLRF